MGRNSWITFGVVAIVIVSLVLVALLILMPQDNPTTIDIYNEKNTFNQSDYTYTQSKDISEETLKEIYTVTSDDVKEGKADKNYKPGNTNPFAEVPSSTTGSSNNNTNNNSGTGNGNTNVSPYSAEDK